MRALAALILLTFAAACSVEAGKRESGGYSVDIRAAGEDQVFVVTAPDGRVAAARVHDHVSAFLSSTEAHQAMAAMPTPERPVARDDNSVSIRAPGFSLHATGDGENSGENASPTPNDKTASSDENGRADVSMNIAGFGLNVNSDHNGGDERAQVRLTGLSEHDARQFITESDDLSPAVQAQMLTALGMSQD